MAQTLKDEVRERILLAAREAFASDGYQGATMSSIARAASVSTGNLYRYYANKDALFYTLFTEEFAAEFLAILRRRVGSLVATENLQQLAASAQKDGEDLLGFWIEHRLRVIVLLSGSQGSRFEDFPETFVSMLVTPTLAMLREESDVKRLRPVVRQTVTQLFDNTLRFIVGILSNNGTDTAIREAFGAFWSYQLAGLQGFRKWVHDVHQRT